MAALDYTNRAAVLDYLTAIFPQSVVDSDVIEALLDDSAGTDCETPPGLVYRPFWVQANVLVTNPAQQFESVTSAAGSSVTYRNVDASIARGLMRRQAILDKSLCSIPPGFEAGGGNIARVVF